jgi:DNA processing protein
MERAEKGRLSILHGTPGLGNKTLRRIMAEYTTCEPFYRAPRSALQNFLPPAVADAFIERRRRLDPLTIGSMLDSQGVDIIWPGEKRYPFSLRQIPNPPQLLYCRGRVELIQGQCLAVVGSRKATQYGRKVARELALKLAGRGLTIVSGLARGIDSQAHLGALEAGGATVSVLGSGINIVYPRENQALYQQICSEGLVISEFPWSTPPLPNHFPMRNRIISGLSLGVLVVEARKQSGALITADFALEQGREVFAVPGPISSLHSAGTNSLIKQGAKLVTCVDDVLEEFPGWAPAEPAAGLVQPALPIYEDTENLVLMHMGFEKCHRDELLRLTGLQPGDLSLILLKLELEGIVQSLPGNYYVKIG